MGPGAAFSDNAGLAPSAPTNNSNPPDHDPNGPAHQGGNPC